MLVPGTLPDELTTSRCILRTWHPPQDATALRCALDVSDAHLRPWIPFMRHEPRSLEDTITAMRRFTEDERSGRAWRYAIWRRDSPDVLVGECMLIQHDEEGTLEVGYWLHVDHQGKGLAIESVHAMCAMAFKQPGVLALCMHCDVHNTPSSALAQKLGATLTAYQLTTSGKLGIWTLTQLTPISS